VAVELLDRVRAALVDRYDVERELGRGGMAFVYAARDLQNERPVAIKVLRPEIAAALGAERFLREIKIERRLQHGHILPLLHSGSVDELPYYVMPFVAGETLRERLNRENQLHVDDALHIAGQVAEALDYAHREGVIHRDVKPENILLAGDTAYVADFGIARAAGAAGGEWQSASGTSVWYTSSGVIVGTPGYMSPEQATASQLDGRSDQYSLACVVYEMLAGEKPYSGSSLQAIVAKMLSLPAPSVRVVRERVAGVLDRALQRGLAKSAADRFRTCREFVEALRREPSMMADWGRQLGRMGALVVVLAGAGTLWRLVHARARPLDPNKVVVYPLVERGGQGAGEAVALMIGSALEHTDPLRWIDGWTQLDPLQRGNLALIPSSAERGITLKQGARWYVDGSIVYQGDSATVSLRLNDAKGDSVVDNSSARALTPQAAQAGLRAVNELLPNLLAPGRQIDLTALADRRPAAVANWLQGEREYRRSNFFVALEYLRRAVAEDSALAVAALRGAQTANWKDLPEAAQFADVALAHIGLLSVRQADFARGLSAYLRSRADSAVYWFKRVLAVAPDWTEAHMALGEVYYHLLPRSAAGGDSIAETEFNLAAADTGFAPPHFHLAEIAIRSGNLERAQPAVNRFQRFGGDTVDARELDLMLSCLQQGDHTPQWSDAARGSPFAVLLAAKALSAAAALPTCAETGYRAVLAEPAAADYHWGAFLGLQGVLAAQGRDAAIVSLVDSLVALGTRAATDAYLIDALAGMRRMESRVGETIALMQRRYGPQYEDSLRSGTRLLLGTWYARSGRVADAARVAARLASQATKTNDPETQLYVSALAAHIMLARGDSAAALAQLETVMPIAPRQTLEWDYASSLPVERLVVADLLFARGRYQEAHDAASVFDYPAPIVYLPFIPASLALRYRAVRALDRPREVARYQKRLQKLGRDDMLAQQ
jgi:tetratricopeptide (TPR) repeat protein